MSYPQETFLHTTLLPGSLVARRRAVVSSSTLSYQLDVLKETGRYDAFKLQWHPTYSHAAETWPVPKHLFWDSDVGKWIEGACYCLVDQPNVDIENAIKELVQMIRSAQQPDGYLNIHYTVVDPEKRFTNLRDMHELYNCGHLIEAALAHNHLYRNDDLLEPMLKYVDLLCRKFGPGADQIHGYPGHPEIEQALLRLHDRTQDPRHLELAQYFITERGNPNGVEGENYYVVEAKRRNEPPAMRPRAYPEPDSLWYCQAHKPIVEQETIEGHSVRAMYLLTAVADLVKSQNSPNHRLKEAAYRLWDNMVDRKMYVTGGIGAIKQWEGFGIDYFLPQGTDDGGCYSETCASIGTMMLAERILQYDLNRKFSDILELCLYNAVLTSMSHDGTKFTYVNQLASSEQDLSKREEWFTCACCPPNVLRLLGSIGGYIYTQARASEPSQAQINVHLFIPSTYQFQVDGQDATLTQKSNWPWEGRVAFELKTKSDQVNLALRVPGWAKSWKMSPPPPTETLQRGYLVLPATWLSSNPSFTLEIALTPRLIAPHPYTNQDTLTLARGPIVYCIEDVDNAWVQDHFKTVQLDPHCKIDEITVTDKDTNDAYVALKVIKGASLMNMDALHASPDARIEELDKATGADAKIIEELIFVPYYFRANRGGRGQMRVGLKRWNK
ncbi:hypothetical protein H2200_003002 [Cladophialophora chaetospira]|uniref:DUF1680-domain-containing protein n=1 Tax=Cladophialophora chaetospira TaxID=386627 RepID=A0AA38XGR2_9EURO|nr:hypothetical protein H2200_003002 [Cladophialophora chaetospira]